MITIFTALYPEAKELIRALSLKKDMTQNHFQVFSDENNQIQIVIPGASAIAAARRWQSVRPEENRIAEIF